LTESSLVNAIAAIKALYRGQDAEAAALLARAEARAGIKPSAVDLHSRIDFLVAAVAAKDPAVASLAADIHRLLAEMP
jgi:hypothetical protein